MRFRMFDVGNLEENEDTQGKQTQIKDRIASESAGFFLITLIFVPFTFIILLELVTKTNDLEK